MVAEKPCLALWFNNGGQTLPAHHHSGSSQAACECGWMCALVRGGRAGIILAVKSGAPAAPRLRTQRHREDSVDNEQPLWCVLQGLVKAKPHRLSEITINCYCPPCLLFHFCCCLIRFHTFLHIILDLIPIMEVGGCFDQGSISFSHIKRPEFWNSEIVLQIKYR